MIWDIYPLIFSFEVVDDGGKNLLDENTSGNILSDDIMIIYDQTEFHLGVDMDGIYPSKAYMPYMYGLYVSDKKLKFGEFEGSEDLSGYFIIAWGDGTYDEIEFEYDFEWGSSTPYSTRTVYHNKEKVSNPSLITIVR